MDTTEMLLTKNLKSLVATLRNEKESRGMKIRAILDFHFIQMEQVKFLLEEWGALEEEKLSPADGKEPVWAIHHRS
jgi:hypothetical protein